MTIVQWMGYHFDIFSILGFFFHVYKIKIFFKSLDKVSYCFFQYLQIG